MKCVNCYYEFEPNNFCPQCGQKNEHHRLTVSHIAHELNHAITHTDKGILLLIKRLFLYPGFTAKEYVLGKRKKYFNPISFLVITTAISAYASYKAGYYQAFTGDAARKSRIFAEAMQIVVENGKLLELFLIAPLTTIFAWLFFKRKGFNLAENFVLTSFMFGQVNILKTITCLPIFLLTTASVSSIDNVFHIAMVIYFIIAYKQFFGQHIVITALKAVAITILYIAFYWVFVMGYVYLKNLILH